MWWTYFCTICGCRYLSQAKVEQFENCRNRGCTGKLKRK